MTPIQRARDLCDEILTLPTVDPSVRALVERIKALLQWEG